MTADIHSATTSVWRRFNASMGSTLNGRKLPVLTSNHPLHGSYREFSLLAALCAVLHDMPELRPRLGNNERVRRLANELDSQRLKLGVQATGISRDAVDIHVALTRLGYTHRYTRPLSSSSSQPTVAEVTDRVCAALAANPYRTGRETDREQVERIVRREYVDVEPWPFGALLDA
jgi:hypothetical protein